MQTILSTPVEITNCNPRKEKHGEELVLAMDINFSAVVDESMVDFLFGIVAEDSEDLAGPKREKPMPGLWDANGNPRDNSLEVKCSAVFDNAYLDLHEKIGGKKTNEHIATFEDAKIKGFKLSPNHGSTFVLKFQAQVNESLSGDDVGFIAERIQGAAYLTVQLPDLFDQVEKLRASDDDDEAA